MTEKRRRLGQFYTPPEVAHTLIAKVNFKPKTVLDLGCGAGALSLAAAATWGPDIRLTTVDVDPAAGPPDGARWSSVHRHFVCDILATEGRSSLPDMGEYDLAILNPPYGRRPAVIHAPKDTSPTASTLRCRSTAFLLRALEAVRPGGAIAAIVPETLATGIGYASNRRAVTSLGTVDSVNVLPARTFAGTEARTVMLILTRLAERKGSTAPWRGDMTQADVNVAHRSTRSIRDLGVNVVRGRMSTVEARTHEAFHLDDFKDAAGGKVELPNRVDGDDDRTAREGDILVARVGRKISDKVVLVVAGSAPISDCIYRLRCPPRVTNRVWNGLRSKEGRQQVEASLSGVTTRLLPLAALLTVRV